ncbi:MAG TPA: hypothetical protein VMW16_15565 [Sedimentisphaerales bacterium]|nr:hypothetical protein [Sedimentisphaerales bacterium]
MKTVTQNCISVSFMPLVAAIAVAFSSQQTFADPNDACLVELGQEAKKVVYLAESVYWPAFDYNDVTAHISQPNSTRQDDFIKLVDQVIDVNYLPENLVEETRFLKGWRGEANQNFVVQYEKQPYLIRIRNQTVTVVASRKWTSHWITIAIQRKDKTTCVNKTNLNAVFDFTDQFLGKKINSKAQNYSNVTNMDRPIFKQIDENYFLSYAVQASKPDIDYVSIWTDGHTVMINLNERRKEVIKE